MDLMAASNECLRHRLDIRSDSSTAGFRGIFSGDEQDSQFPARTGLCVDVAHRCAAPSTTFRTVITRAMRPDTLLELAPSKSLFQFEP
jgi:hypothetical protein